MIKEETKKAIEKIRDTLPADRLLVNEPMSRHTSFRIGGPAALFAQVNSEDELCVALKAIHKEDAEYMLVGNGSNLLVSDEGYPGIVIKLGGEFDSICILEDGLGVGESVREEGEVLVRVGAARLMSPTSSFLTDHGLSGFEFASGIPGSIGGAVFMNAGAYGGEMKDIVESVRVLPLCHSERSEESYTESLASFRIAAEDMHFDYRSSRAQDEDMLILSATLRLKKDEPAEIASRVRSLAEKRNSKQPVNYPSAGSTFKRPVGGYAAALIEDAGLKGYRVGGAAVSEKHAGFVINEGDATAEAVLAVMRHVRETVYKNSGIMLEPEVRLVNCEL